MSLGFKRLRDLIELLESRGRFVSLFLQNGPHGNANAILVYKTRGHSYRLVFPWFKCNIFSYFHVL